MWLMKMAWKNMWRNRHRTLITMAAIFFAVILSVLTSSLKDGIFNNLVKNVVSFYTGYIQVHQKGYWDEQILDNCFMADTITEKKILLQKNVTAVTGRLESFALVSKDEITRGSLVSGINPEMEQQITLLKNKLVAGSYLNKNDQAVLMAQGLAEKLKVKINDTIVLMGQGYHGSTAAGKYLVKGLLKFGSPELNNKSLFMPLETAQEFYSANGMVTAYILALQNTQQLQATKQLVSATLGNDFEVMTWEEIMPDIKQHIETDSNNMKYIQGILYMLICFGIFGTLLMMMVERKYEMGMLVAVGMKKIKLIYLLIIESVCIVFSGCIVGILAAVPLIFYLKRHPIKIGGETAKAYERFGFEAIFPTSTEASVFLYQGLIVLILGLILSLYPVYKVIRLNPISAMKR